MLYLWIFLFQNTVGSFGSDSSNRLVIPHVTSPVGGFSTSLIIDNVGQNDSQYVILEFDEDGQIQKYDTVTAFKNSHIELYGYFGPTTQSAVVLPERDNNLEPVTRSNIFMVYEHQSGLGSPAIIKAMTTEDAGTKFRFFPGNWDVHFDGLGILFQDYNPIDVSIRQYSSTGELIAEELAFSGIIGQPFKKKRLYLLGSPEGSKFHDPDGTYFEIDSTGLISIIALRGNTPGFQDANLWATPVSLVETANPEIEYFEGEATEDGLIKVTFKAIHFSRWTVEFATELTGDGGISALIPEVIDGVISTKLIGFQTDGQFRLTIENPAGVQAVSEPITVHFPG